ncbi:MAG: hypothetical protein PHZ28_02295 [Candidatus Izemoplasmatales bacterium]|nr:hypothetical protein [Candidatus Izemoplasmatales bacterium]
MKKNYFVFPETEHYREYLGFRHLRGQNALVSLAIFLMMALTIIYMVLSDYSIMPIIGFSVGYLVILIMNFATVAYSQENYYYLKLGKYITSIALFTMMIITIIYFKSPSFIPLLFVAYAICSIYKDTKVLLWITLYFVFAIIMLILNFGYLFDFQNVLEIKDLAIGFFVVLFILILLLSSLIIVKEKTFFYNNISYAKEKEFRNLNLLMEFETRNNNSIIHQKDYYQEAKDLLSAFAEDVNIKDTFSEKLDLLKKIANNADKKILLKEYPNFSADDLEKLEELILDKNSKLRRIILKLKHTQTKKYKTREIFSATHFQSFNKQSDSIEVKILCFVVYYVALKKGLPGMKPLSNQELYDGLLNTDLHHFIDPKIIKIYRENFDVFNTIADEMKLGGEEA